MDEVQPEALKNLDALNEKLDEILIQFFDTLESLYKQQADLEEQMKNGFLQMSRARYNMGIKAIGALQFNEKEMTSSYFVDTPETESLDCDMFVLNHKNIAYDKSYEEQDIENVPNDKVETPGISGLRKRNIGHSEERSQLDELKNKTIPVETVGQSSDQSVTEGDKKFVKLCNQDPIKWFGVLVPQSLRQSQTSFKHSIHIVVHIANLQNKLRNLKKQYIELMAQKLLDLEV